MGKILILLFTFSAYAGIAPTANDILPAQGASAGKYLKTDGSNVSWQTGDGSGTVTSVGLSLPSIFTISSSPVTTSGTLTGSFNTQSANAIFSGPASGGAATPTFRALVSGDIPSLSYVSSVGITAPIASSGGLTPTLSCNVASGSQPGCLASADWTIFNGKQNALSFGALSDAGTDGIIVTNGAGSVIGSGTSFAQHVSDATHNGYLSSTDWSTFNNKQASGNYLIALTGDVTASGPGSVSSTVAKIQGVAISSSAPTNTQVLTYNSTSTQWEPRAAGGGSRTLYIYRGHINLSSTVYYTTTSSTVTDWTVNGSPSLTQDVNKNFGTVAIAASSLPGIGFTAPATGTIRVDFFFPQFSFQTAQSSTSTVELFETNSAQLLGTSFGKQGLNGQYGAAMASISGFFDVTASTSYEFKLEGLVGTGSGGGTASLGANSGGVIGDISMIMSYAY